MQNQISRTGTLAFLVIMFAITYALEGMLSASGFRFAAISGVLGQYVVLFAMWVPAQPGH